MDENFLFCLRIALNFLSLKAIYFNLIVSSSSVSSPKKESSKIARNRFSKINVPKNIHTKKNIDV